MRFILCLVSLLAFASGCPLVFSFPTTGPDVRDNDDERRRGRGEGEGEEGEGEEGEGEGEGEPTVPCPAHLGRFRVGTTWEYASTDGTFTTSTVADFYEDGDHWVMITEAYAVASTSTTAARYESWCDAEGSAFVSAVTDSVVEGTAYHSDTIYDPPILTMVADLAPGVTWGVSTTIVSTSSAGTTEFPYSASYRALDYTDVTTALGARTVLEVVYSTGGNSSTMYYDTDVGFVGGTDAALRSYSY